MKIRKVTGGRHGAPAWSVKGRAGALFFRVDGLAWYERFTGSVILDFANPDGTGAFASVATLARSMDVSMSTVKRGIAGLRRRGILTVLPRDGVSNDYVVNVAPLAAMPLINPRRGDPAGTRVPRSVGPTPRVSGTGVPRSVGPTNPNPKITLG